MSKHLNQPLLVGYSIDQWSPIPGPWTSCHEPSGTRSQERIQLLKTKCNIDRELATLRCLRVDAHGPPMAAHCTEPGPWRVFLIRGWSQWQTPEGSHTDSELKSYMFLIGLVFIGYLTVHAWSWLNYLISTGSSCAVCHQGNIKSYSIFWVGYFLLQTNRTHAGCHKWWWWLLLIVIKADSIFWICKANCNLTITGNIKQTSYCFREGPLRVEVMSVMSLFHFKIKLEKKKKTNVRLGLVPNIFTRGHRLSAQTDMTRCERRPHNDVLFITAVCYT